MKLLVVVILAFVIGIVLGFVIGLSHKANNKPSEPLYKTISGLD